MEICHEAFDEPVVIRAALIAPSISRRHPRARSTDTQVERDEATLGTFYPRVEATRFDAASRRRIDAAPVYACVARLIPTVLARTRLPVTMTADLLQEFFADALDVGLAAYDSTYTFRQYASSRLYKLANRLNTARRRASRDSGPGRRSRRDVVSCRGAGHGERAANVRGGPRHARPARSRAVGYRRSRLVRRPVHVDGRRVRGRHGERDPDPPVPRQGAGARPLAGRGPPAEPASSGTTWAMTAARSILERRTGGGRPMTPVPVVFPTVVWGSWAHARWSKATRIHVRPPDPRNDRPFWYRTPSTCVAAGWHRRSPAS